MVIKKLLSKLPESALSKLVLKGILRKSVDISDETYQKDFKNFAFKVNWNICGAVGYQIYAAFIVEVVVKCIAANVS